MASTRRLVALLRPHLNKLLFSLSILLMFLVLFIGYVSHITMSCLMFKVDDYDEIFKIVNKFIFYIFFEKFDFC